MVDTRIIGQCQKCNVKLESFKDESGISVSICPICKRAGLRLSGDLLSEMREQAQRQDKTLREILSPVLQRARESFK